VATGPPSRYRVEFARPALKEFQGLPRAAQEQIRPVIDSLAEDPRPNGVKKLKGASDLYRVRAGNYRVVYEIRDALLIVTVVRVADRRDAYRRKGN
jgi:mRNA interferase RelE/StbE